MIIVITTTALTTPITRNEALKIFLSTNQKYLVVAGYVEILVQMRS
jgi:hypothetical protein